MITLTAKSVKRYGLLYGRRGVLHLFAATGMLTAILRACGKARERP
jgi:hypothetical protein